MKSDVSKMNILYAVFTAVILLAAVLPFAAMPFYENTAADAEQRELAEFPSLIKDGDINESFGTEFEDWFRDRFAFRSEMVNAGSEIMAGVFDSSSEDSVIYGRDDWLFYAETLEDYCGTKTLTESEIGRLATVIRLEQEYCEANGAIYVFAAAPNKNSVYPEYMQFQYIKTDEASNIDRLNEKLSEIGVNAVDLKAALLEAKSGSECELYYSADSHWNIAGAVVAYNEIMSAIGEKTDISYDDYGDAEYYSAEREGDLLKMVSPLDCAVNETAADSNIENNYKYIGRFRSIDDLVIKTENSVSANGEYSLLMFRDSFGRALIPIMSEQFASASYLRATPFNLYGNIDGADVVVREIVERNLDTLLERAPVTAAQPAAVSESFAAALEEICDGATVITEKASGGALTHLYGFAETEGTADKDYRVYALYDSVYYEGYPIYEDALTEEYGEYSSVSERIGFSFYFENPEGGEISAEDVSLFVCWND